MDRAPSYPSEPPTVLYHYTTTAGLVGIVENKCLWASRAQHLNDRREIGHAFGMVADCLTNYKSDNAALIRALRDHLSDPFVADAPWVFVASLTKKGDDLSQWRAYGGDTGAYCLGFSGSRLADLARTHGWRLLPCLYDEEKQRRRIVQVLDECCHRVAAGTLPKSLEPEKDLVSAFIRYGQSRVLELAPTMKHPAFIDEQEWRLIRQGSANDVKHRAGTYSVIPYVEFPLPMTEGGGVDFYTEMRTDAPRSVTLGPTTADPNTAFSGLHSLLFSNQAGWGNVDRSAAPYRAW